MNTYGHFTHPEVISQVNQEFKRLYKKHPDLDGHELWGMARDYAYAINMAESSILRCELAIQGL